MVKKLITFFIYHKRFIYIYIYNLEIIFYHNLSIYVCEAHLWGRELRLLFSTLHKYLYSGTRLFLDQGAVAPLDF